MSKRISINKKLVVDHHRALTTLAHIGPKRALIIIDNSPEKLLHVLRILSKLLLDGSISLKKHHVEKLKKHKSLIRQISKSKGQKMKKILHQNGGSFFKTVLTTLLPLIPMLL